MTLTSGSKVTLEGDIFWSVSLSGPRVNIQVELVTCWLNYMRQISFHVIQNVISIREYSGPLTLKRVCINYSKQSLYG